MKIIFLAYRDWALNVYHSVKKNPKISDVVLCKSNDYLKNIPINDYDLIISIGWSNELGSKITSNIEVIGVHCAELDRYSYGTPIQLQINDGITRTKHRVFSFTYDKTSKRAHTHNRLFSHEVDLDLSGNMTDILYQMEATSIVLFNRYIDDFPNIHWVEWPEEDIIRKKRIPEDSKLLKSTLQKMNTIELYNFFRSLEDPYPNGYIEDEYGKLFIKKVEYKLNGN
jgi:hypothetical protein